MTIPEQAVEAAAMKRGRSNWADHAGRRNDFARKVAMALQLSPGVVSAWTNGNVVIVRAGDNEYTITVCIRRKRS